MATNPTLLWGRLTSGGSNTDATSYAAASVSPVSGQVIIAAVVSLKATTPDTPTASGTNGFNGTWTQIGSTVTVQTPAGNWIGLSLFWSVASSNTAGVLTFSFGGNTQLAGVWDILTSPFINTATPVVQSKTATSTDSSTTMSITLDAALSAPANWVLGAFAHQASGSPALTSVSSEYSPSVAASPSASDGAGLRLIVGPTITSAMQTFTANVGKIGFVIEVAQDGTGAGGGGGGRIVVVQAGTPS